MKYLIAGLGNVGEEYVETRHNIGFKIVEALAEEAGASFVSERFAMYTLVKIKGRQMHLIKPATFMNLSGKAVKYWMDRLEISKQNILIIVDDIAIPFGNLRIRSKGSDGNHNGLTSIQEALGTTEYPRLRFGIEGNFPRGRKIDYVLGKWTIEEKTVLPQKIKTAAEATKSIVTIGLERTMNIYNKAGSKPGED
ncbi:MAG: aminoacyl-tRNA hydrolase [Chitinophagales bacterium]|nr:aminoacyl-tRNA hydrolase [Chitinophagales bacterium]